LATETLPANRFQETFGTPSDRARTKVKETMSDEVQEFIRESPFVVLATSESDGRCDASPKGGKTGFVKVLDDRHLLLPDVAGNRLFQSYENIDGNAQIGLLFLIPGSDKTVRVNGNAKIVDREELDRS
jgi:predicted pyridoxine 5'-phosphate oxidase superfamily flavin-nucleotide-binding protein